MRESVGDIALLLVSCDNRNTGFCSGHREVGIDVETAALVT